MEISSTPTKSSPHPAFSDGRSAGLAGDDAKRGVMVFCSAFAADATASANIVQWLNGFDAGAAEAKECLGVSRGSAPDDVLSPYDEPAHCLE